MHELLGKLRYAKIFSTIDYNEGYYQIPLAEEDIQKTGFKVLSKTYLFKRMPFGLCNAPDISKSDESSLR